MKFNDNQIRDTKYGGALGRVIARYTSHNPPRVPVSGSSCCLRVEFYTGCCQLSMGFSGVEISYRFIRGKSLNHTFIKWYDQ